MHKIKVSHCSIDQRFEWGQSNALKDPRPKQTIIIVPFPIHKPARPTPNGAEHDEYRTQNEQMAFSPKSCSRYAQDSGNANAAKVISGK